jgi:hypothetical protein
VCQCVLKARLILRPLRSTNTSALRQINETPCNDIVKKPFPYKRFRNGRRELIYKRHVQARGESTTEGPARLNQLCGCACAFAFRRSGQDEDKLAT